jgi:hypothetical protein
VWFYDNTSHGRLNVSPSNAVSFYDNTKRGDIIEVLNTLGPRCQERTALVTGTSRGSNGKRAMPPFNGAAQRISDPFQYHLGRNDGRDSQGGDPIQVTGNDLADRRLSVSGWYSGVAQDSEDTLNFAVLKGVRPIIETYPLEHAEEAWQQQPKANLRSSSKPTPLPTRASGSDPVCGLVQARVGSRALVQIGEGLAGGF